MSRTFTDAPAVRDKVPLLVGLVGPSGGGKTFSALRLAAGMQRVVGGDIFAIDTESRRMLHYADRFTFRHVAFGVPYSPNDYLAAIRHCVAQGASIIIVDSMSHEHEGPGGVLEWHDEEMKRIAGGDPTKEKRATYIAWAEPKKARRALINEVLQLGVSVIYCFRAKEKLNFETKPPKPMGWMPIAGEEFQYEMTVNCLLPPAAGGVPEWNPERPGERQMVKLPEQFAALFAEKRPLSEDIGEEMARWAAGDEAPTPEPPDLSQELSELLVEIGKAPNFQAGRAIAWREKNRQWSEDAKEVIRSALETLRDDDPSSQDPPDDGGAPQSEE